MASKGNVTKVTSIESVSPDGFGRWIARYLEWMRIHNYSPMTVERREAWLCGFARWCDTRGLMEPRGVTRPHLERYQKHLFYQKKANGHALSFATQASALVPVKSFFSWMTRQNALLSNPASDIELPRLPKRLPHAVLSVSEVERVLGRIDVTEPQGVRDRAIVEVLYSTGIRRSELVRLKLKDIDSERGTLLVREGKGRKDRMVPLGARAAAWVDRYLFEVRPKLEVDRYDETLFLGLGGDPLDASYLTHRVGRIVDAAELGKTGACHLFRHTMATLMLEGGADIRYIQHMLGHASLESTEIYTRVSIRMLKAVHEATHPAGRKAIDEDETTTTPKDEKSHEDELILSLVAESEEDDESASDDEAPR